MTQWTRMGAMVAVAALITGSAFAQTRAPFPERQPPDQPEQIQPRPDRPPRAEVPMPDREPSNPPAGVIRPPPVQDRGVLTPPNTDRTPTPEIRPPGTPGGNPNIQPR